MIRHLSKLLDMIWYLSMGLFLGLTGGLVLAVILTFRGAREINAKPGVEPYSDPMFAEYHNAAVAGYIGQDLFMVGGKVALILFAVAFLARITLYVMDIFTRGPKKRWSMDPVWGSCMGVAIVSLALTAKTTVEMNEYWPSIYDQTISVEESQYRRAQFDTAHHRSEKWMRAAWIFSFVALTVSPWSRRPEKTPLQSGDGKED